MNDYLKLLRPHHWIKNLLVFAGIFFAGNFFQSEIFTVTFMFLAFCIVSSAVYVINDIKDVKLDLLHPKKKHRPLPSGKVSLKNAKLLLSGLLVLLMIFVVWLIPPAGSLILAIYLGVNLLYVYYSKNLPILDVFSISLGYILRVLAGTVPIALETSLWLLVTIMTLSLFLAVTKRAHELKYSKHKKVLKYYTEEFLDNVTKITITLSLVFYTIYVITEKNNIWSFAGLFIVYAGIFKYLLIYQDSKNSHDPIKLFFTDKWLVGIFAVWAAIQALGLYLF